MTERMDTDMLLESGVHVLTLVAPKVCEVIIGTCSNSIHHYAGPCFHV